MQTQNYVYFMHLKESESKSDLNDQVVETCMIM